MGNGQAWRRYDREQQRADQAAKDAARRGQQQGQTSTRRVPGYSAATGGQTRQSVLPNYAAGALPNTSPAMMSPRVQMSARSTPTVRGADQLATGMVAGPVTGNTPATQFSGSIPRFANDGRAVASLTGPVPQIDASARQGWRDVLGLPQGVTYQTEALGNYAAGQVRPMGGNQTYKLVPYQPKPLPAGFRGDNSAQDKAYILQQNAFQTPYGSVYYSAPQGRDWLNYSPPVSASTWFDDTLKYRGTGTTTDLYNPKTLQGRGPIDMTITPKPQAAMSPWMPAGSQTPGGGGGGGGGGGWPPGGGGGGGGGYGGAVPYWYGLVNWRL